jgi:hypothetical protein
MIVRSVVQSTLDHAPFIAVAESGEHAHTRSSVAKLAQKSVKVL